MENELLIVLAAAWEEEAKPLASPQDGSQEGQKLEAHDIGHRECKLECADTLRILVAMLKERHP